MRKVIELAALPPAAQLCLQTAIRCHGLIKTEAGYIGRIAHPREPGTAYTAAVVAVLMLLDLASPHPWDDARADVTDAGVLLTSYGRVEVGTA